MYARSFGATRVSVPVIGQGTWHIDRAERVDAVRALRAGIDAGMTHIDTAEMYGDAEAIVAEAIADCREEVFLVSKVVPGNATRRGVTRACEASLRRLKTDRLDSYLLHWPGQHPLEETIAGFEDLRRAGKILSWGLSNFDVDDLDRALAIAGPDRIACNQVLYHLNERAIEHAVLPWCERHGVAMVGYSPFGRGEFPDPASVGGGREDVVRRTSRGRTACKARSRAQRREPRANTLCRAMAVHEGRGVATRDTHQHPPVIEKGHGLHSGSASRFRQAQSCFSLARIASRSMSGSSPAQRPPGTAP